MNNPVHHRGRQVPFGQCFAAGPYPRAKNWPAGDLGRGQVLLDRLGRGEVNADRPRAITLLSQAKR
ncbi:MAG: hypothetical protein ACYC4B_06020, partial [Pirellulaceae bacterium]